MKLRLRYFGVLGIAIFVWLISSLDLVRIAQVLSSLRLEYAILAAGLIFAAVFLRSVRWRMIAGDVGARVSYRDALVFWLNGIFWGLVTPGKMGEMAVRTKLLKNAGALSTGRVFSSIFIDRAIELCAMLLLGFAGAALFLSLFSADLPVAAFLFATIACFALIIVALREGPAKKLLRPAFRFLVPEKRKGGVRRTFGDFYAGVRMMKKGTILAGIGLTGAGLALTFLSYVMLGFSLGLQIPLFYFVLMVPVVELIVALPVSISGIGTRDVAYILLFSFIGITAEVAVSFSLVELIFINWIIVLPGLILNIASRA